MLVAVRSRLPRAARVLITARRDFQLDELTSAIVEVVFRKPWPIGSVRRYLEERLGA